MSQKTSACSQWTLRDGATDNATRRAVNRNVVVLPKSVTEQRIIDNLKIVKLDAEDMDTLNSLYKTKGQRFIKPE